MAASMSDYLRNKLLRHLAKIEVWAAPATWYVGLCTTACTSAGIGTECAGGSYARKSIAIDGVNVGVTANALASAIDAIFANLTGDIGTPVSFFVMDSNGAGNLLLWGDLAAGDQKHYVANDQPMIPSGNLTLTLT